MILSTDGQRDRRTGGQTDKVKPVYPLSASLKEVIINTCKILPFFLKFCGLMPAK